MAGSPQFVQGVREAAGALGMDPTDLATIISYETAGTFDPVKKGPTTQWGQHKGLIQFGEPQARAHGVDWNNPEASQLGADGAIVRYFRGSGWKPGMGMLDAYSIVNAGGPGLYNRSDANNGGAPGTVADKVRTQMGGHRKNAIRLLGGSGQPPQATVSTKGTAPMMQQKEQQPRGFLEGFGVQRRDETAGGETAQPFHQRDSFKDTAALLAQGFGRMGIMGMEEIADDIAKQRTEVKAKNKTMEMLSKLPNGEHLMRVAEIAGPKAAVDLYISEQRRGGVGGVGGVQSSSALPDMSGVILTLRDGSIQVKTAGGETLSGQAAMDFVRKSQETAAALEQDIYSSRRKGTNTAEAETGAAAAAAGKSGELTMDRGFQAFDDAVKAGNALSTIDEAIAALDSGAKSGIVYNMLPNVTGASASLSNAMNRMGLDVISSVTFGALSEAEMKLAMETAVPRGLSPAELRPWLVKKRNAQAKAREALMNAARYLTQPGNTLSGWMAQQTSAPAPVAPPAGGSVTRLKFNTDTGELE